MEEGDHTHSIAVLSRAISLDPSNPTLFKLRATAHFNQGDYTAVIANYNKTVSLCPEEAGGVASELADAHFRRGEKLLGGGDYELALADFMAASELCPEERIYITSRCVQWAWLVGVVCLHSCGWFTLVLFRPEWTVFCISVAAKNASKWWRQS
jgi:tetratricopeptide (TPR) repeat protein